MAQFDKDYEYKFLKKQTIKQFGEIGGDAYDLIGIGLGGYQIYDAFRDADSKINTIQKGFEIFDTGEDIGIYINDIIKTDSTYKKIINDN